MTRLHYQAAACIVTGLMLTGCSPSEQEAEKPRPVRTVIAEHVYGGDEIVYTGEMRPHIETDLGFRIDGRVMMRKVDVGDLVVKGQLLATLDPSRPANELRVAEADYKSALSSEALAKINVDRQRALLKLKATAQAMADEAETNWRNATLRRESAAATLENARDRLNYTRLVADDEGIVTAIGANAGQVIATGQMVVRLASTSERDAVFSVSEKVIHNSSPDVEVQVRLMSAPSVSATGYVRDVSPTADSATRSYRVRVALPDAPPEMSFGATVSGQVVRTEDRQISVPASALTSDDGVPAVYVLDAPTSTLKRKAIAVSRYTSTQIFISSGLDSGEKVVVAGVSKLRPGQRVAMDEGVR